MVDPALARVAQSLIIALLASLVACGSDDATPAATTPSWQLEDMTSAPDASPEQPADAAPQLPDQDTLDTP